MIAELLERRDLGANRNELAEDLHFGRLALDGESARARRLKSDEEHQIPRIGQPLRQMMQNASARHHAARRNDDRRHLASG